VSVTDGTADYESARPTGYAGRCPGSTPRRGVENDASSECAGKARDLAEVVDQVRSRAKTVDPKTLEPDGEATGCNPVEVGSTPTGVSDRSTAGSDYIFAKESRV
jgi:hypothetical protein